jgi:hypothetical protein
MVARPIFLAASTSVRCLCHRLPRISLTAHVLQSAFNSVRLSSARIESSPLFPSAPRRRGHSRRGQQPGDAVIGFLGGTSPEVYVARLRAFHQGLKEAGYVEGRNVAIEYFWAEGHTDRLPALAAELARRRVAVSCRRHSKGGHRDNSDPLRGGVDPIELRLVASLN